MIKLISLALFFVIVASVSCDTPSAPSDKKIVKAVLESCPGCSLNRLHDIKQFVYQDLPRYGIEFKKIHGAPPELIFYNLADEVVERHLLGRLTRQECNELLVKKGFTPDPIDDQEL